ncbi:MAG: ATP-binding cassette domain-containing protein, partial [Gemmatimonadota bacterium]|nr:ATP-binding cassette domain-containing protein [Gemmatimonadota bacterium]
MNPSGPALELRDVRRQFGSVLALDEASLVVAPGTLHVLLGENGAGKTTMLRIAAGLDRADAGTVRVEGRAADGHRGAIDTRQIAVVSQHHSLIRAMTVAENVALNRRGVLARFNKLANARAVADLAARAGLPVDPLARVTDLPVSAQQRVEILKAMAAEPRILVLDEPTAVLAPPETEELFAWLRRFVSTGGTAVVITHRLRDALRHADAITVLRRGRSVLVTTPSMTTEAQLVGAIVGDVGAAATPPSVSQSRRTTGPPVLAVRGATIVRSGVVALRDVNLEVGPGELVGV